jgi:hypothetical protein
MSRMRNRSLTYREKNCRRSFWTRCFSGMEKQNNPELLNRGIWEEN